MGISKASFTGVLNIAGVVTPPVLTATVTALPLCCPQQDPSALDMAIQHALAGLYPPFEATAPTVLGQVFRLLDSDFRGDGLSFLLDFLIPAKRLCEQVREAACVSREAVIASSLRRPEGWHGGKGEMVSVWL